MPHKIDIYPLEGPKEKRKRGRIPNRTKELWNLGSTIAKFVLPRLIDFRAMNRYGYPGTLESPEEWDEILDKMIWSFEQLNYHHTHDHDWEDQYWIVRPEWHDDGREDARSKPKTEGKFDVEGCRKHHEKINLGLELFGKYLDDLWD